MIEVDNAGIERNIIFTNQRLINVRTKYKVTWRQLTHYLRDINFELYEHLQGKSTDPDKRYVSQQLLDIIDRKFCSNKGLDGIML